MEYYRQLAQKEKVEREKKKLTKRRNFMHLSVSNQLVHEQIDLFCLRQVAAVILWDFALYDCNQD